MKRILALILCFCLCVALIPAASAEDPDEIFILDEDFLDDGDDDLIDIIDPGAGGEPDEPEAVGLIATGPCGLTEDDDLVWKLYSDGELRIVGTGEMMDYHWFEEAPWKEYDDPDSGFRITDLTIGEGVETVGFNAFTDMDALETAYLPASLTEIAYGSFGGCNSLAAFTVSEDSVDLYTKDGVLFTLDEDTLVIFPAGKVSPWNYTYTVPEGTLNIAPSAFYNTKYLSRLYLPDSLVSIGEGAFRGCEQLRELDLPSGITKIPRYMCMDCSMMWDIYIPPTVTSIAYCAFANCRGLHEVYLPRELETLDVGAFMGSGLQYVEIPDSITELPYELFMNCPWLETVVVGKGVTDVDDWVFYNCESLERVIFTGNAPSFVKYKSGSPEKGSFLNASCTALYPAEDASWTSSVRSANYGGNVTWKSYTDGLFIKIQPLDYLVYEGWTVNFNFRIGCTAKTVYQWQYKTPDALSGSWKSVPSDWSGYEASLSFPADLDLNGSLFRCKLTSGSTTIYTDEFTLTVKTLRPGIVTQPKDQCVPENETATFKVKASGPELIYEWQYNTDPNDPVWRKCSGTGAATNELQVVAKSYRNGYQYRCRIYNTADTVYTKVVSLSLLAKPVITTQPKSITAASGDTATFKVKATGGSLSYQWQYRTSSSGTWKNATGSGADSASYPVTAASFCSGYQYRCKVTNAAGTTTSKAATLTVGAMTKPSITTQPKNVTTTSGNTVTFTVVAKGGGLSYQWQFLNPSNEAWANCSGESATTAKLSVEAKLFRDGYQYRCKVSNDLGSVTSNAATLTVETVAKPTITKQPSSVTAMPGTTASFSVTATGTGTLTYQWYYRANSDNAWAKCTGGTGKTLSVEVKNYRNGYQYYCAVTNAGGTTKSKTVTLTVQTVEKPTITKQPSSLTYPVGGTANFSVKATGEGTLTYQWYYRANSDNAWAKCTGGTGTVLSVEAKGYRNGYQYRCGVTNEGGTVYTVTVTLTVMGAQQQGLGLLP